MNTDQQRTNRRSSKRLEPRNAISLECRKGSLGLGPNLAAGFLDISEGGARLYVRTELKPNDEVEIVVTGYGIAGRIKRSGQVCWVKREDDGRIAVGVHFSKHIPFRELAAIARLA